MYDQIEASKRLTERMSVVIAEWSNSVDQPDMFDVSIVLFCAARTVLAIHALAAIRSLP